MKLFTTGSVTPDNWLWQWVGDGHTCEYRFGEIHYTSGVAVLVAKDSAAPYEIACNVSLRGNRIIFETAPERYSNILLVPMGPLL